jgi:hypothetical protein
MLHSSRKYGSSMCQIEYEVSFVSVECILPWSWHAFLDGQFGAMMNVSLTNEVWHICLTQTFSIRSDVFIYVGTCYSDVGYSEVRVYSSSRGSKQKEIERE